jgi:hypothetical protein
MLAIFCAWKKRPERISLAAWRRLPVTFPLEVEAQMRSLATLARCVL